MPSSPGNSLYVLILVLRRGLTCQSSCRIAFLVSAQRKWVDNTVRPLAAPREQGQHYIRFTLNPRYSAVSAISYMRHHGMGCSILKLYCMFVHHTNKRTCALSVHKDGWNSVILN